MFRTQISPTMTVATILRAKKPRQEPACAGGDAFSPFSIDVSEWLTKLERFMQPLKGFLHFGKKANEIAKCMLFWKL